MFDQVIKLDPNFANAYCNKGIYNILFKGKSLYCLKRFQEAKDTIEQAIKLDT